MTGSATAAPSTTGPTQAQVTQVRAFNRFYTNVIGVLHDMYLDTPYTLTESRLLYEIARHGTVEVSWLRQALDIDAGYLSRVLSRFESEGLVTRQRSATDARRQEISATDAGRGAVTQIVKMPNRGHSLTIDHGWPEVAQTALDFVKRFT